MLTSIIKFLSPSSRLPILLNTKYSPDEVFKLPADKEKQFLGLLLGEVQLASCLIAAYHDVLNNISDKEVEEMFIKGESFRDKLSFFLKIKNKQNISDKDIDMLSIRMHRRGTKAANILGFIEHDKIIGNYDNNTHKNYYNDPNMLAVIMSNNSDLELKDHRKTIKSIELIPITINGEVFDINTVTFERDTSAKKILSYRNIESKKDIKEITGDTGYIATNQQHIEDLGFNLNRTQQMGVLDINKDGPQQFNMNEGSHNDSMMKNIKSNRSISPKEILKAPSSRSKDEKGSRASFVDLSRSPPKEQETSLSKIVVKVAVNKITKAYSRGKTPDFGTKVNKKKEDLQAMPLVNANSTNSRPRLKSKRNLLGQGIKTTPEPQTSLLPVRKAVIVSSTIQKMATTVKRKSANLDVSSLKINARSTSVTPIKQPVSKSVTKISKKADLSPTPSTNIMKKSGTNKSLTSKSVTARRSTIATTQPGDKSKSINSSIIQKEYKVDAKQAIRGDRVERHNIKKGGTVQKITKTQKIIKRETEASNHLPLRKDGNNSSVKLLKSKRHAAESKKKLAQNAITKRPTDLKVNPTDKSISKGQKSSAKNRTSPDRKIPRKLRNNDLIESTVMSDMTVSENGHSISRSVGNGPDCDEPISTIGKIINSVTLMYGPYRGYKEVPYAHKLNVKGILLSIIKSIGDNIVDLDNYDSNKQRNINEMHLLKDYTNINADKSELFHFNTDKRKILSLSCMVQPKSSQFDVDKSLIRDFMFDRKEQTITTDNILADLDMSFNEKPKKIENQLDHGPKRDHRRSIKAFVVYNGLANTDREVQDPTPNSKKALELQNHSIIECKYDKKPSSKIISNSDLLYKSERTEDQNLLDILNQNSHESVDFNKYNTNFKKTTIDLFAYNSKDSKNIPSQEKLRQVHTDKEFKDTNNIKQLKSIKTKDNLSANKSRSNLEILNLTSMLSNKTAQNEVNIKLVHLFKKILIYGAKIEELKNTIFDNNPKFNLISIFELYDDNNDGLLVQDEFIDMILDIGFQVPEVQLQKIMLYLQASIKPSSKLISVRFSQFLNLFYPLNLDPSFLYNLYQTKQEQKKDTHLPKPPEELVIQEAEFHIMRQIVILLLRKIEDTTNLVDQLRDYRIEELFSAVTNGLKTDITWKILCDYLETNGIKFLDEDVFHIFRDFMSKNCAVITYQNFSDYFNQPLWDLN